MKQTERMNEALRVEVITTLIRSLKSLISTLNEIADFVEQDAKQLHEEYQTEEKLLKKGYTE